MTPSEYANQNTFKTPSPSEFAQLTPQEQAKSTSGFVTPITSTRTAIVSNKDIASFKEYNVDQRFYQGDWFDQRAQNQSPGEKWLNSSIRTIGSTATKIMADVGYLGGAIGYAATGDINQMTQNGFSAYFEGLEHDMKDALPIYKPSWVQNGNFWDQVGSLSFWMDDVADGAAFMASMMVPGLAISKGLKIGSKVASIINKGTKVAGLIDTGTITVVNTIGEAAIEAKGVQNRVNQQLAQRVANGTMTQEEADKRGADAARDDFFANSLILLGPNLLQSRWLLGKVGFGSAEKLAAKQVFNPLTGELIGDVNTVTKRMISKKIAKEVLIVNPISEGLWEENAQLAIENYNVSKQTEGDQRNVVEGLLGNMADNFSTTEGQISMFLGAILGGPVAARGAYKSSKAEKAQIESYHKLFGTNYQAYSDNLKANVKDVFKKQVNPETNQEEFVLDEKGKRVVDQEKLEVLKANLENISNFEQARTVALLGGDKTGFDYFNNLSFANWVIPMLESGESSLDMVNKQIDLSANSLQEEIKSINEAISPQEQFDIDKFKDRQKAIAKDLYDVIQKETDYSEIWDAPKSAKTKEEVNAYNNVVKNTIREKAFQQSTISWLESYQNETKAENKKLRTQLTTDTLSKNELEKKIQSLKDIKKTLNQTENLTEEDKLIKNNYKHSIVNAEIEQQESDLKELKERIKTNEKQFEKNSKKIESFGEAITERKDVTKGGLVNLSNRTLETEIKKNWEKAKTEAAQKAEEVAKEAAQKAEEENKDSNTPKATKTELERLKEELIKSESEFESLLEQEDTTEEEVKELKEKIAKIKNQITEINNGVTANQTRQNTNKKQELSEELKGLKAGDKVIYKETSYIVSEVTKNNVILNINGNKTAVEFNEISLPQAIDIVPEEVISETMNGKQLNPSSSSFKEPEILESLDLNNVLFDDSLGQSFGVIMHTQLEHTRFKLPNGKTIFYFNSDPTGSPIPTNSSAIDFDFVNNPDNLSKDSEVEYEEVTLTKEQQEDNEKNVQASINTLKKLKKQGKQISEENNWGFGDTSKAIGIFAKDATGNRRLAGYYPIPKSPGLNSKSLETLLVNRELILQERKEINEKLKSGPVKTTVQFKGTGNVFTRRNEKGKPDFSNMENSSIFDPSKNLENNQIDGKPVLAYYNSNIKQWVVKHDSTDSKIAKQYELAQKQASLHRGNNGQIAMLVKTANGTWAPIPAYLNKQNDSTIVELEAIFEEIFSTQGITAKEAIIKVNDYVYASMDSTKSKLRIFDEDGDIKFYLDGKVYSKKTAQTNRVEFFGKIKELKQNVNGNLNSKSYQDQLQKNNTLVTNVFPVNSQYFLQPYIKLNSIIPNNTGQVIHQAKTADSNTINTNNQSGVEKLINDQEGIERPIEGKRNTYIINGVEYERVSNYVGLSLDDETAKKPLIKAASALGTATDELAKDYLNILEIKPDGKVGTKESEVETFKNKFLTNPDSKIGAFYGGSLVKVIENLKSFAKPILEKGGKFRSSVVVWGTDSKGNKVAGEIDLLIEYPDGTIELVDLKVFTENTVKNFTKEYDGKSKTQTTGKQLSAYNILLNNQFGITTKEQYLVVIPVTYKIDNGFPEVSFVGEHQKMVPFMVNQVKDLNYNNVTPKTSPINQSTTVQAAPIDPITISNMFTITTEGKIVTKDIETIKVKVVNGKNSRIELTVTKDGQVLNGNGTEVTDKNLVNNALYEFAASKNLAAKLLNADGPKSVKVFVDLTKDVTTSKGTYKFIYLSGEEVPEKLHLGIVEKFQKEIEKLNIC